MSFLHRVRLAFAGRFQADVSTVNNDVRHYDNATFEPSYQAFQQPGNVENGWWNPTGSGAFRLLDCVVTGVWYADGSSTADPAVDPIVGALVGGADARTSGKIVDIDPQWQLASALWGLEVRLLGGRSGNGRNDWFGGRYLPNAFRDLWFSRNPSQSGDRAASATFQSVLEDVTWSSAAATDSRALRELRSATAENRLSIRIATFGYQDDVKQAGFTVGTVIGAIGPYLAGEPTSFVRGRRFTPAAAFNSWAGVTWFSGSIDEDSGTLLLDLSNAFQITDAAGTPVDVGSIRVGILKDADLRENTPVTADSFDTVAEIPYKEDQWLQTSGGVFAAMLSPAQWALARAAPLALVVTSEFNPGAVSSGEPIIGIRESDGGLMLGIEPSVLRVDAGATASATVFAAKYGKPLADVAIQIAQTGPAPGQGGGSGRNPNPPAAPIYDTGKPLEALTLPTPLTTGPGGTAALCIQTSDPGNPRKYIDGQIYMIDYRLAGQSYQARSAFDYLVVHLRDAYTVPADPVWCDIEPIFVQYGNLYPIMSKGFIRMADQADVIRHARLLHFAFTRDISDPNHMPVTRDLSAHKREAIVKWLAKKLANPVPDAAPARAAAAAAPGLPAHAPSPGSDGPPPGSKSEFAKRLVLGHRKGGQ